MSNGRKEVGWRKDGDADEREAPRISMIQTQDLLRSQIREGPVSTMKLDMITRAVGIEQGREKSQPGPEDM